MPSFAAGFRHARRVGTRRRIEFRNVTKRFGSIRGACPRVVRGPCRLRARDHRRERRRQIDADETARRRVSLPTPARSSRAGRPAPFRRPRDVAGRRRLHRVSGAHAAPQPHDRGEPVPRPRAQASRLHRPRARCVGARARCSSASASDFDAEPVCGDLAIAEQHLIEIAKGADGRMRASSSTTSRRRRSMRRASTSSVG